MLFNNLFQNSDCFDIMLKNTINSNIQKWRRDETIGEITTLLTTKSCTSQVLVTLGFFVVGQQKIRGVTNARLVLVVIELVLTIHFWNNPQQVHS
jgi:hypothetical protein